VGVSNLNISIGLTIQNEGGFVDNPNDKGHATKYGITQEDLPGQDIEALTEDQATAYYQEHFVKPWMSQIVSQPVTDKVFDMSVLLGVRTAVRMLQRALGFPAEQQDGEFGDETSAHVNDAGDNLLPAYKRSLAAHFQWIVNQDPSQNEFLNGWLRRVNS
ncbi:MAG: glycoside hydrolase family 108 protein, partial [Candidatus Dormibacteria bacterium]